MRYDGKLYRPPSEARSFILQATIGCSHNLCTYCDMYRDKKFRIRSIEESLEDIEEASEQFPRTEKVFVADGDALAMPTKHWLPLLEAMQSSFPKLRQVSCYATAENVLRKPPEELALLREHGLSLLYLGPESGDNTTLKRIVKGGTFEEHELASRQAHDAGMRVSVIMLLGAGGVDRTEEHARESARLITAMDPEYLAALTLTIIPGTPMARQVAKGGFELPSPEAVLLELRTMVDQARPTSALFRTNHASNYLPTGGRLPEDRERLLGTIDAALSGALPLRGEGRRGL
ncbi:MAG: radical SAM protein [Myxococcales bacterium]|nr:radical SAM protein [Myxococcales bacterium]